jgi:hypothetical protein
MLSLVGHAVATAVLVLLRSSSRTFSRQPATTAMLSFVGYAVATAVLYYSSPIHVLSPGSLQTQITNYSTVLD